MKPVTASRDVDDSERSLATFSMSIFPDIVLIPSRLMSSGPSAATTISPVKVVHVERSDASCDVLIVISFDAGAQSTIKLIEF